MQWNDITVNVIGGDDGVGKVFLKRGAKVVTNKHHHAEYDVQVFTGGLDVVPFLYGERPIIAGNVYTDWERDMREIKAFKSVPTNKPRIGICRGAQLLNVLSGGRLWQDVDGHKGAHILLDKKTGRLTRTTSTHHQMMRLGTYGQLVAVAGMSVRRQSEDTLEDAGYAKDNPETWKDVEVAWYGNTNSLCFQGHPEYGLQECEDYFGTLVERYIFPILEKQRSLQ